MAETERLEREEQVTRDTAYQIPPVRDPNATNFAAPDTEGQAQTPAHGSVVRLGGQGSPPGAN